MPVEAGDPNRNTLQMMMNSAMATTLMVENQNSNSPKLRAESRLEPAISKVSTVPISHTGRSTQSATMPAPAIASMPITTAQKYQ